MVATVVAALAVAYLGTAYGVALARGSLRYPKVHVSAALDDPVGSRACALYVLATTLVLDAHERRRNAPLCAPRRAIAMALCSALLATTLVTLSVSRTAHLQCADTLMALSCSTSRPWPPARRGVGRCGRAAPRPSSFPPCRVVRHATRSAYVATLVVEVVMIATFLASLVA